MDRLTEHRRSSRPAQTRRPPPQSSLNSCSNPTPATSSSGSSAASGGARSRALAAEVVQLANRATRSSRPLPSTSPSSCANSSSTTIPTVVLTSATLTVQGGFDHIRSRLGLTDARELVVPSHFHYGEQALLYLPPNMPDPREPEFPEAAASCIRRVLEITERPRLLPLHQLRADARPLRAPAARARLSDPSPRHRTAQRAARSSFATRPTPSSSAPPASGRESTCRAKR